MNSYGYEAECEIWDGIAGQDVGTPTTQECRGCGESFPYDSDADYCPGCAAENAGAAVPSCLLDVYQGDERVADAIRCLRRGESIAAGDRIIRVQDAHGLDAADVRTLWNVCCDVAGVDRVGMPTVRRGRRGDF